MTGAAFRICVGVVLMAGTTILCVIYVLIVADYCEQQGEHMKNCPECGNAVSTRATTCPHCGRPMGASAVRIGVILFIGVIIYLWAWIV